ncbi:MAG: thiamine pyrophosphate-dependent enzyme, partial [Burkholderiales bacterium]|nr:thiamine pyrophosphate-dependent enzyme [Burkholderiales bacterium]
LRMSIQALDRRVAIGHHVYPEIPLGPLVDTLLARLPARPALSQSHEAASYPRGLPADDAPITPLDIATAINDLMDAHGKMPIATDIGDCMFLAMDVEHTALVAPGYYATMGFGVPAGLGLQAATGQRPLIIVGDGAFQMTGWELGNCARHGWDPIVLLINNASWEMLRAFQPDSKFNNLDQWRFAQAATALGGEGVRVRSRAELAQALSAAQGRRGRFQLIEAMVARGAMSPTLARFVEGDKSKRA